MRRKRVLTAVVVAASMLAPAHAPAKGAAAQGPAVLAFGDAANPGDPTSLRPHRPVVGMASTPDGGGYWLVATDGGVFSYGTARFFGSTGGMALNRPIVGMAAAPDGNGYWLVASDGGVFAYGSARFFGSTGAMALNRPVVGIAAAPDGNGYWLVATDGGVFSYGSARFFGSTGGIVLNKPVIGMAAAPDGNGYWLVATDGGIFAYGTAAFRGSAGSLPLQRPIVGMAARPDGVGYWLVASDGGVFSYGTAQFHGSAVGKLGGSRVVAAMARSASGNGYNVLAVPASMRVGFAGDVHGVGRVGAFLAGGGNPLAPMAPLFAANDVNVVNLETAVGSSGSPQAKQYTFHSPPSLLRALRSSGVQVVSLANNHSLDFGAGALLETIGNARSAGLAVIGAGANASEAFSPAVVSTPGGTVALIGLSQVVPPGWAAGPGRPGVASAYDFAASTNAVRAARSVADHVVVVVHWGDENADCPNGKQTSLANALFGAGADGVVGHHPHRLQGVSTSGSRLVAYSLGNFVWYNNSPPNDLTGLLSVEFDHAGVRGYEFAPARIDGNGTPVPLTGTAAAHALGTLNSLRLGAGRC
jgi:hypothetical protein